MSTIKPSSFILIKTNLNARKVLGSIQHSKLVKWSSVCYGPYQIIAYVQADTDTELTNFIENLRAHRFIQELDARLVKVIPKDEELLDFSVSKDKVAVLGINVNYKEEKERVVTYNLRKIEGIKLARAMWGPTDVFVIVEAEDGEAMRNKICDEVKTMKGVISNTTYYCYPL
jgi:DNA-binding Lrp family transcriptional regulator